MSLRDLIRRQRTRWWLRDCERVGADPWLHAAPTIYAAPGRLLIGDRFTLASSPVASHMVVGPEGVLEIGDGVAIGHGSAIAAFAQVSIGSGTSVGPFLVLMDTNFHGQPGDQSVQHDCKPVAIGRNCRIGSRVTITRGASIGDGAEILAGSVVSSAIPAGACAGGARARVLGAAGDPAARWDGAAALLPEIVRATCSLDVAPELHHAPRGLLGWNDAVAGRLVRALHAHFGIVLPVPAVTDAASWHEVVDLLRPPVA